LDAIRHLIDEAGGGVEIKSAIECWGENDKYPQIDNVEKSLL
jgi:hypothetical protein